MENTVQVRAKQKSPGGQIGASLMDQHMDTLLIQVKIAEFDSFFLMVTNGRADRPSYTETRRLLKNRGAKTRHRGQKKKEQKGRKTAKKETAKKRAKRRA